MEDQRSRGDVCQVEPIQKIPSVDDLHEAHIVGLTVQGMGCVNCATRVRNSLLALVGVVSADVDWERGLALVDYVPAKTNVDTILQAVAGAGNDGHHSYSAQVIP
ncbi:MAG: heavy-metal-associated domain-containing protein [Chloroflexota bacterium]|nr:heavy-metal-associated domain-containing protein [Chloroflexota bacterium]